MNVDVNESMKEEWTITKWNNELSSMVDALTFYCPLPIECTQLVLIESFQQKDYRPLLYALRDDHYKLLDLDEIINIYHQNIMKNKNEYYPLKRFNIIDLSNSNDDCINFHPLLSIYEFSSSHTNFIDIISMKNGKLLSEFLMANFIFENNSYLLKLMFQRLSFLELNKHNIHCIYNKINHALKTKEFISRYQESDISMCLNILNTYISQRIMSNTNVMNELLSSQHIMNNAHLIKCVLHSNPWPIFERLSVLSTYNDTYYVLNNIDPQNDILFILSVSTLTLQSAPSDILNAHKIELFINKTYNSWNKILSFLISKKNSEKEIYECHSLIIKAVRMYLESSQYLCIFKAFGPAMNSKYCSCLAAQMWIETTPNNIYNLWKMVTEKRVNCEPHIVVNDIEATKPLIEEIMSQITNSIPSIYYTPLQLSKYPFAAFSDLLSFVVKLLSLSNKMRWKRNIYVLMMQSEAYILALFEWYHLVNNCMIHDLIESHDLTLIIDQFMYEILHLFRILSVGNQVLYKKVTAETWKSWNILYKNVQNSENTIFEIFNCECKGINSFGCTKDNVSRNHSLNVIASFITSNIDDAEHSLFPLMHKMISMCCDIPSLIRTFEFCSTYIMNMMQQINEENILETNITEHNGLLSLAETTKNLFMKFFYDDSMDISRYSVCDKILKLWGTYLSIHNEYSFDVLVGIQCHLSALETLSIFNIKNGPVLFNLLMEKTKELKMDSKRNDNGCIQNVLRDIAQNKFCKILMNLNAQWINNTSDNDENEELSAQRIGYIIEGLKHLIEMNHSTLNTQLFGLLSTDDLNYPLFFYSICKLIQKWNSPHFETDDIKNLLIILDLADKNSKWARTMNRNTNKDKSKVITRLFSAFYQIINNEQNAVQKCESAKIFTRVKQKMMRYVR